MSVQLDRPAGQPGIVRGPYEYPAVQGEDGVTYWCDTTGSASRWIAAPGRMADTFQPDEEWKADCPHEHGVSWRTCDTYADCLALKREDEAKWGDR